MIYYLGFAACDEGGGRDSMGQNSVNIRHAPLIMVTAPEGSVYLRLLIILGFSGEDAVF
jgi:hypothetical protein